MRSSAAKPRLCLHNFILPLSATGDLMSCLAAVFLLRDGAAAASVNKARHSQPPVGSKILLEIFRKYGEQWLVELLFDDL